MNAEAKEREALIETAIAKELDRCVKIIQARADFWNQTSRNADSTCALPLAEECEDIIVALQRPRGYIKIP